MYLTHATRNGYFDSHPIHPIPRLSLDFPDIRDDPHRCQIAGQVPALTRIDGCQQVPMTDHLSIQVPNI